MSPDYRITMSPDYSRWKRIPWRSCLHPGTSQKQNEKMARIVWTEPALNDLNEIAEYIAISNFTAAQIPDYWSIQNQRPSRILSPFRKTSSRITWNFLQGAHRCSLSYLLPNTEKCCIYHFCYAQRTIAQSISFIRCKGVMLVCSLNQADQMV